MFKNITNQFCGMSLTDRKEALAHVFKTMFGASLDSWKIDACIDMVKGKSIVGKQYKHHSDPDAYSFNIIANRIYHYNKIVPVVYNANYIQNLYSNMLFVS